MHISLTFGNKIQSCFCYIERWINDLPCSEILKFLAWVVFKLLSKSHGGLQKPCRWEVNALKKVEEHRVKIKNNGILESRSLKFHLWQKRIMISSWKFWKIKFKTLQNRLNRSMVEWIKRLLLNQSWSTKTRTILIIRYFHLSLWYLELKKKIWNLIRVW